MNIDGKAFIEQKNKRKVPILHGSIDFVDLGSRNQTLDESNKHRGAIDPEKNTRRFKYNVVDCKAMKARKARVGDTHNSSIHEKVCT